MIGRIIEKKLIGKIFKNKVIIILGARQTGKTSLIKKLFSKNDDTLWLNGDEYDIQERFKNATSTGLKALIGKKK